MFVAKLSAAKMRRFEKQVVSLEPSQIDTLKLSAAKMKQFEKQVVSLNPSQIDTLKVRFNEFKRKNEKLREVRERLKDMQSCINDLESQVPRKRREVISSALLKNEAYVKVLQQCNNLQIIAERISRERSEAAKVIEKLLAAKGMKIRLKR